jgi:hypothetical protein
MFYFWFQQHLIAFDSQAKTQGVLLISGWHDAQVYFIFFLCSSVTTATVLSSRSMNSVSSLSACSGHFWMHLPQLLHLSESTII